MLHKSLFAVPLVLFSALFFSQCSESGKNENAGKNSSYYGYESQVKWGAHLVAVGGCGDCHTPKKMGPMGPEDDSTLMLSGHPAQMPLPDFDRSLLESKRMAATQTLTFWIGPWGVSYAANLTPDSTGMLAWTEEQFITALRDGFSKGIKGSRMILPPMPVQSTKNYTDDELKAMFAYLKTIKPVKNAVPQPLPPVLPPPPPPQAK